MVIEKLKKLLHRTNWSDQLDNLYNQFTGNTNLGNISKQYAAASHNAKIGGMIKIIVGVMMACVGTWMVKDEEPVRVEQHYFELEKDYDDWR